ncbi:NAD(P)-dependent oxidoreductase [Ferrovum sp. PN-J185]|uniref:NAD(P)-dependent oxidoreductase n=1 Tax=Ferrovum sp. PN-J185 TaxID=1356306 RepID=UPI000792B6AD|nr:NAD(P)-dependent oxidoreductase [Ferrovum sp. PN-J185]KXW56323.1 2-hydroxy-3-oxopropionate reductase [Ferrovum sp. PN-J185]MCC6069047.1 NAD(P)-dependent oxidoreductase [Ferrovum sp. PN-J185]MDE1890973.1 NAD(P)-dependent oxidoreductase [Betaproteobacteria bacterium]MDE2055715.1 NAD(P)-dependent oxidoreductase [Betaproteobacteria bacterium]
MKTKCALIGTGLMGTPIAKRLLDHGYELVVWNRTRDKCQPLVQLGANLGGSIQETVADAHIIITMLTNGAAVTEVLQQGILPASKPGDIFIDMSSIPPHVAKQHAQWCREKGVDALDAPVSGGVVGAEQGSLAIMVGGEKSVFDDALPLFNVLGRATYVGEAGAGALAKLANQMIVGMSIAAVAEAMTLMAKAGADAKAVREAIRGGFAESRVLELHGQRMVERSFKPGAHATTQLKDLNTALDVARQYGLDLPVLAKTQALFQSMVENGLSDLDHSGLIVEIERLNSIVKNH